MSLDLEQPPEQASDGYGSLFDGVDARTRLAGTNKLEILLFTLGTQEQFGINVFKVREVCRPSKITRSPNMPHGVEGFISLRGNIIPVLNMASFLNLGDGQQAKGTMMVTEYSRHVIGFLVDAVNRIVRVDWSLVHAPENMISRGGDLITAITELPDGSLVSIVDVEQILSMAFGEAVVGEVGRLEKGHEMCVFFVDDSPIARKKIRETLDKMGVKHMQANNGREAWEKLKGLADAVQISGGTLHDQVQVVLADAEMPEMDGYVLTQNVKADKRFDGIPVVMHSSLSSQANRAMGKQVGVDHYVPKFDATMLADTLRPLLVNSTGEHHG
jgi:two-component system chemotaxis response regulator CheV